jgi:hypothetical protein
MDAILDLAIALISLAFLGVLGIISGVAVPGLFMAAAAPWLDWILPDRKRPATTAEPKRSAPDAART